jgi:thioredoxin-related protein
MLLWVGISSAAGKDVHEQAAAGDAGVRTIVEGLIENARHFEQGSFELSMEEFRYVPGEDGAMRRGEPFTKSVRLVIKGENAYFRREGKHFSGVTKAPGELPTVTEGAFRDGRFIVLEHTFKSMNVFAEKDLALKDVQDPRQYLGFMEMVRLQEHCTAHPDDLLLRGQQQVHGAVCQVLELATKDGGQIRKYWIDPEHGFLPRRMEIFGVGADPTAEPVLITEVDLLDVTEVADGVWAPVRVRQELFHGNREGFHCVRNVVLSKVDISSPIPDATFVLERPAGYYVNDYVHNRHYHPETEREEAEEAAKRKTREPIYDEKADAKAQIAAAVAKAKRENKRVLIVYGGNWCSWCYKLHGLFAENEDVRGELESGYEVVLVDINSNQDVPKRYGARPPGFPYLTVLDAAGKAVRHQSTGELEKGPKHDPEKVLAFLRAWRGEPLDAEAALQQALSRAKAGNKRVFVRIGAPWCGWCRRLDDFVQRKTVAENLEGDFVMLKIDLTRMVNGPEVARRLRGGTGGIPWFAFLEPDGQTLITSDGPHGNIGYPVKPEELAYFKAMLTKSARTMSAEQIDGLIGVSEAGVPPKLR